MYNNHRYRQRTSIRHGGGFNNGFGNRPQRGGFNQARRSNNVQNQRKSQLEGANINMFIKKANPNQDSLDSAASISFEQLDINPNLKHTGKCVRVAVTTFNRAERLT